MLRWRKALLKTLRPLVAAPLVLATASCDRSDRSNDNSLPDSAAASPSIPVDPVDSAGMPVFGERGRPPEVTLAGAASAAALPTVAGSSNKLAAIEWETAVHKLPDKESFVLGFLRAGAVVSASDKPQGFKDCKQGWYRIAPFGYVCVSERTATLDLAHEVVRALTRRPELSQPLPYMYGIVRRPGPVYARLPSIEEATAAEPGLEDRVRKWLMLEDEDGAAFRADAWHRYDDLKDRPNPSELWSRKANEHIPWYLADGRTPPGNLHGLIKEKNALVVGRLQRHQGFAFVDTAVRDGRRYAITTRQLVIPVDRLRPIKGSRYHGYEIPGDITLPFAIVRSRRAHAYKLEDGRLRQAAALQRRAAIKLTGKQNFFQQVLHFETSDGYWLSDREVSRLDPANRMPKWGKNGERWLDVNITKQTLVAYDGTNPVFATLVSTGEAGLGDPEKSRATKRGIFRIDRKHVTATMDSDIVGEEFELQDIPFVQYFEGGYALHAAYWHDDFGVPRSHGCINLSPDDARRLFYWTEPKVPPGWHTVRRPLTGSVIFVHP